MWLMEKGFPQGLIDVFVRILLCVSVCRNLFHYRGTKRYQLVIFFYPQTFFFFFFGWGCFDLVLVFWFCSLLTQLKSLLHEITLHGTIPLKS